MSELNQTSEPRPQDPELLACQVKIKDLCDEILGLKPEHFQLTFWDIQSGADPDTVQERLREITLGDLLLKDGDSLSMPGNQERYPNLGLYVGRAVLTGVSVRAWGWEDDKYRIDPNGPDEPPYDTIFYPDEQDWSRELNISLRYSNGEQTASQTVITQTGSRSAGNLPSVSRNVYAPSYAETGYEGHNLFTRVARSASEIEDFVALARELIEQAS